MCDVCIAEPDSGFSRVVLYGEIVASYNSDSNYADIIAYLQDPIDVALDALLQTKCD